MVDLLQNTLLILHMFNLLQSDQVVEGQGFQGVIGGGGCVVGEGDRGEGAWSRTLITTLYLRCSERNFYYAFIASKIPESASF